MRRAAAPFYALIFLTEVVWVAIVPVLPNYAERLSLSKVETGTVLASAGVATLVVSLPIGLLADRIGTRTLTVGSAALVAASTLGQGLAVDFWSLLVMRAAFGIALGTIWTAGLAWSSGGSPRDRQAESLGLPVLVAGLGIMSGPAFAGVLAGRFGVRVPFLVLGVASLLVTLAFAGVGTHETAYRRQPLGATLRAARGDRVVLAGAAVIVLVGIMGGAVNLLVPLELRRDGLTTAAIGLVISGSAAVFVLGSAFVTRLGSRAVTLRFAGVAALLYAVSTVIPVATTSAIALVAFLLVRSPSWSALSTLAYPLGGLGAQRADVGAGAVMGLLNLLWGVAGSFSPIAAGAIAQAASERWAFAGLVACSLATGLWLLARREVTELAPALD